MESYIKPFVDFGVVGATVIVEGFVIGYLFKELKAEKKEHLQDVKDFKSTTDKALDGLKSTMDTVVSLLKTR